MWQIRDLEGKTTTYSIAAGTKIKSKGFLVFERPQTKIVLNNDKDGLELLDPGGEIIDKVIFENSSQGESFNRFGSRWQWSKTITPNKENILTEISEVKSVSSVGNEKSLTNGGAETGTENLTAQVRQNNAQPKNKTTFIIAVLIALSSVIFVLILRKRQTPVDF